jgi:hypothetical protein
MINRAALSLAAGFLASRVATAQVPLSAQFLPPESTHLTREFRYALNDRAYVAVFVILPGRGVALLYPFNPPSTLDMAGDHAVSLQSASVRHDQRASALLAEGDEADKPYLLLVASRQRLRVDPYLTRQEALDSAIGPAVQRGTSLDAVMTGLVKLIANVTSGDDIATDVDQARSVIPSRREAAGFRSAQGTALAPQ